jgi:hypothetical protein
MARWISGRAFHCAIVHSLGGGHNYCLARMPAAISSAPDPALTGRF